MAKDAAGNKGEDVSNSNFKINAPEKPLYVTISKAQDLVNSESSTEVTTHVTSTGNTPVYGATVIISVNGGSLTPSSGTTDSNGNFVSTYKAPVVSGSQTYTISSKASLTGYTEKTASDQITVNPVASDWNPWNDPDSEEGDKISTLELLKAANTWQNDETVPETGAEMTTLRLLYLANCWQNNVPADK